MILPLSYMKQNLFVKLFMKQKSNCFIFINNTAKYKNLSKMMLTSSETYDTV